MVIQSSKKRNPDKFYGNLYCLIGVFWPGHEPRTGSCVYVELIKLPGRLNHKLVNLAVFLVVNIGASAQWFSFRYPYQTARSHTMYETMRNLVFFIHWAISRSRHRWWPPAKSYGKLRSWLSARGWD